MESIDCWLSEQIFVKVEENCHFQKRIVIVPKEVAESNGLSIGNIAQHSPTAVQHSLMASI